MTDPPMHLSKTSWDAHPGTNVTQTDQPRPARVAILWPGGREVRHTARLESSRHRAVAEALKTQGLDVVPAVYHDEFADEVGEQIKRVDAVLVWVNPIEDGRGRSVLDAMLRDVADTGVFVSAHPDVILKMGTKEVLYRTRNLGWGCDTHLYASIEDLRRALPPRLTAGEVRVLKQYRGNGGNGVWKVQRVEENGPSMMVRVRHALRGAVEQVMPLAMFFRQCEPYFAGGGRVIDQAYQDRLPEGMIRCYLVHDRVVGFGHQAVNALFPAPPGELPTAAPQPGPRLYYPSTKPEFQQLKEKLETHWLPAMQKLLDIATPNLPVIWDADFLLGPTTDTGEDRYVLCEINASSVHPFPDDALPWIAKATVERIQAERAQRSSTVLKRQA